MKKEVRCDKCGKRIKNKNDANNVAAFGLILRTYCNDCYALQAKTLETIYYGGYQINSKMNAAALSFCTMFIFLIWVLIITDLFWKQVNFISDLLITWLFVSVFLIWGWILFFKSKNIINSLKR